MIGVAVAAFPEFERFVAVDVAVAHFGVHVRVVVGIDVGLFLRETAVQGVVGLGPAPAVRRVHHVIFSVAGHVVRVEALGTVEGVLVEVTGGVGVVIASHVILRVIDFFPVPRSYPADIRFR